MPCYHPQTVYRSKDGPNKGTGNWPIVFNIKQGYMDMSLDIPCGKCIGCRLEHSRQWAIRCVHESSMWPENCFITLTYDDNHIDKSRSLNKRDFPLFMKRLRKQYGDNIRFFHGAEYGEICRTCGMHKTRCICKSYQPSLGRPHHHACLFNHNFPDRSLWSIRRNTRLFTSVNLQKLWPFGFSTIGDVTFESAAYVARYVLKKITGERASDHYGERMPEHTSMSRRPGLARPFVEKYMADIYTNDQIVIKNDLICRPPRYYDSIYDDHDPVRFKHIKKIRKINALNFAAENTPERLEVREKCKQLQIQKLKRGIENGN